MKDTTIRENPIVAERYEKKYKTKKIGEWTIHFSFNFENIFYIPFIKSGVLLTKYIIFTLHTYCLYEKIFYKIIKNYKFHNSLDYIYIYNDIIIF